MSSVVGPPLHSEALTLGSETHAAAELNADAGVRSFSLSHSVDLRPVRTAILQQDKCVCNVLENPFPLSSDVFPQIRAWWDLTKM